MTRQRCSPPCFRPRAAIATLLLLSLPSPGPSSAADTQHDPDFWTASSELGAEEVQSAMESFVQDDIERDYPGRIVPAYTFDSSAKVTYESTWDAADTLIYPGSGDFKEIYDYWDFYYHIADGADHPAGVSVLQDLADHGGVMASDDSFHLYLASPGSSFQAKLSDMAW